MMGFRKKTIDIRKLSPILKNSKKALEEKRASLSLKIQRLRIDGGNLNEQLDTCLSEDAFFSNAQTLLDEKEFLEKEWERLTQHPKFLSGTLDKDHRLLLQTKPLFVKKDDWNEAREIGEFTIRIDFSNTFHGGIKLLNTTRRCGSYDSPTILNTSPCWGNVENDMEKLFLCVKISELFQDLIDYIESPNTVNGYISLPNAGKETGWEQFFKEAKKSNGAFDLDPGSYATTLRYEGETAFIDAANYSSTFSVDTSTMWQPIAESRDDRRRHDRLSFSTRSPFEEISVLHNFTKEFLCCYLFEGGIRGEHLRDLYIDARSDPLRIELTLRLQGFRENLKTFILPDSCADHEEIARDPRRNRRFFYNRDRNEFEDVYTYPRQRLEAFPSMASLAHAPVAEDNSATFVTATEAAILREQASNLMIEMAARLNRRVVEGVGRGVEERNTQERTIPASEWTETQREAARRQLMRGFGPSGSRRRT